jgi:putative endonuclease
MSGSTSGALCFVYIIRSRNDPSRFYTGVTADVNARIAAHNAGRSPHTSRFTPWELVVSIEFAEERRAIAFEKYLSQGLASRSRSGTCVSGCPPVGLAATRRTRRQQSKQSARCTLPTMRLGFSTVCVVVLCGGMATAHSPRVAQPARSNSANGNRQFSLNVIRDRCLDFTDVKQGSGPSDFRECRVSEFGEFGVVDGETYYYALYCLIPSYTTEKGECGDDSFIARYHRARGLAVFVRNPSRENARLLFERVDPEIGTVYYEKPEIVHNPAGTLLYLPVAIDGTGRGNESDYYLRETGEWVPLETAAWLAALLKRIPAGLEIWKGVWPDLRTMRAEAGLYRAGDANCCPTGGVARVRLAIRSRQLVIDSVVIDKEQ